MQQYINSHFSYDEILDESLEHKSQKQSAFDLFSKKGNLFCIHNKKYDQPHILNKILPTSNSSSFYQHNPEIDSQQYKRETPVNYTSDFQSFQQEIQESVKELENNLQNCKQTKRETNKSVLLPKVNKLTLLPRYNQNRCSEFSRESLRINKSTCDLRQMNRKLVKSIEAYRNLIPVYKKNKKILIDQHEELKKMKFQKQKLFSIGYQLNLDKKVQSNLQSIDFTRSRIRHKQTSLNNKKLYFRSLKSNTFKGITSIGVNEEDIIKTRYMMIREDLLSKKRQEDAHTKKLDELNTKIKQYEQYLSCLIERQKVGRHQDLKIRKIVLEYDMTIIKTMVQQKECSIMIQIAEMNNQSSQLQVEILKINQKLKLSKIVAKQGYQNVQKINRSENRNTIFHKSQDSTPIRAKRKLVNFFANKL